MREGAGNYLSGSVTFNFNIYLKFPWHKLQYLVTLGVSLNFIVHLYWDGKGQITISLSITKSILLSFEMISIYIQHYLSFFYTDINTKCYKLFTSFALIFSFSYFCIIFFAVFLFLFYTCMFSLVHFYPI